MRDGGRLVLKSFNWRLREERQKGAYAGIHSIGDMSGQTGATTAPRWEGEQLMDLLHVRRPSLGLEWPRNEGLYMHVHLHR